jgi:hypothetical protein
MTDEQEKKKIRPLYNELQGYLTQAPTATYLAEFFDDKTQWEYVDKTIDRLNTATRNNYDQFKIVEGIQNSIEGRSNVVRVSTFKTMLAGLISYLHGEYFYDEPSPFSGVPSTVITQYQNQQQSVNVLILEMQRKIDEKLAVTEDEKEKGFLKKLQGVLPTVTTGIGLVKSVFDLAAQMGLDPHQISRLFS